MKKFLMSLFLLATPLMAQQQSQNEIPDQFQMFTISSGAIMHKIMEKCKAEGYPYFIISKLTYKDSRGQKGEFVGITPDKKGGVVLKESMSDDEIKAYGKVSVSIEVVAYAQDPQNPLAANVNQYHQMIQAFQQRSGQ